MKVFGADFSGARNPGRGIYYVGGLIVKVIATNLKIANTVTPFSLGDGILSFSMSAVPRCYRER